MNEVIKIENLYKEYKLGVIGHGSLYRDLQSFIAKLKGKEDQSNHDRHHQADANLVHGKKNDAQEVIRQL